jgi:hypothetical protein
VSSHRLALFTFGPFITSPTGENPIFPHKHISIYTFKIPFRLVLRPAVEREEGKYRGGHSGTARRGAPRTRSADEGAATAVPAARVRLHAHAAPVGLGTSPAVPAAKPVQDSKLLPSVSPKGSRLGEDAINLFFLLRSPTK